MKFYSVIKTTLLLSSVFLLSACEVPGKVNDYDSLPGIAYGHIINASPSTTELDFFLGDSKLNRQRGLSYGEVEGSFEIYTGNNTFTLKNNNGDNLASVSQRLSNMEHFSVFAINTPTNIELKVYKDVLGDPSSNSSLVQFINLSPDSNPISIKNTSMVFKEGLSFKETTGYGHISNNTHVFTFSDTETGEEILTESIRIIPGRAYTIFTKGYISAPEGSSNSFSVQVFRHY